MLTPTNICPACGFRGAMNQGIRLQWGSEPRQWTCFSCVSLAQEVLFAHAMQLDPPETRAYYARTYYYMPA